MRHRVTRTNFDHCESRRDHRYRNPVVMIRIDGHDYPSIDWSLGGFQINARELTLRVGDGLAGLVVVGQPSDGVVNNNSFGAEITWSDRRTGAAGARFTDLGAGAFRSLDKAASRWLKG